MNSLPGQLVGATRTMAEQDAELTCRFLAKRGNREYAVPAKPASAKRSADPLAPSAFLRIKDVPCAFNRPAIMTLNAPGSVIIYRKRAIVRRVAAVAKDLDADARAALAERLRRALCEERV